MFRVVAFIVFLTLTACSDDSLTDVKRFVADSGKEMRGKVDPLPQVKPYEPFIYSANELQDPFKPRKIQQAGKGSGLQPDLNRPKEILESYSLETLRLVGTMAQGGVTFALLKTPDGGVYRIKAGNYVGQNFGMVTSIKEGEVLVAELAQDGTGDWAERQASILLAE